MTLSLCQIDEPYPAHEKINPFDFEEKSTSILHNAPLESFFGTRLFAVVVGNNASLAAATTTAGVKEGDISGLSATAVQAVVNEVAIGRVSGSRELGIEISCSPVRT